MKRSTSLGPSLFLLVAGAAALATGCAMTVGLSADDGGAADAVIPPRDVVAPPPDATAPIDVVAPPPDVTAPIDVVAPPRDVTAPTDVPMPRPDVVVPPDSTTPDSGCNPVTPPEWPRNPNMPGGIPAVYVIRRLNFGFESRTLWGQHGFDRDGLCTDPARFGFMSGSCRPRDASTMPPEDGFNGRDNSFAPRLGGALQGAGWTETGSNDSITNGTGTIALRISDYGGDDDGRLQVEWLPVIHGHRPGDPVSRPMFDGTDVWHINRRVAYDPGAPSLALVRDAAAFSTRGQLRMAFPARAALRFLGARYPVRLTLSAGLLVAPVRRGASGEPLLTTAEISALWPLADALEDLTTFGVCPRDTLTYTFVTGALQGAADILGTLENGPMIECDAISVGFGVDLVPITLGPDEEDMPYNEDLCATGP